jgi:hypothetical protein
VNKWRKEVHFPSLVWVQQSNIKNTWCIVSKGNCKIIYPQKTCKGTWQHISKINQSMYNKYDRMWQNVLFLEIWSLDWHLEINQYNLTFIILIEKNHRNFPRDRKLYDKSQCSLMRKTLTNIKIDTNFLKLIKNDYKILTNKKYLIGKIL